MSHHIKPNLYIIYSQFYSKEGDNILIGGIQNYILGLVDVFHKNFNIKIIQSASNNFTITKKKYKVYGFKLKKGKLAKQLYYKISGNLNNTDYLIWASDRISYKSKHQNTISIQHGITFDFIDYKNIKFAKILQKSLLFSIMYRQLQYISAVRYFLNSTNVVCVDYNFLNWVRTILPRRLTQKTTVITNYSKIPKDTDNNNKILKILFARRFVEYRGVYIIVEIVKSISKKYNNIQFGIYGEGPLEEYIRSQLASFDNVVISSFGPEKNIIIPLDYQIAIIPTIGSEGTSLSLIESMACGCVPIASNVGGMTNILLDNYNGFLVNPDSNEFERKIEFLIANPNEVDRMSKNAKNTIKHSFSFSKWRTEWEQVFEKIRE